MHPATWCCDTGQEARPRRHVQSAQMRFGNKRKREPPSYWHTAPVLASSLKPENRLDAHMEEGEKEEASRGRPAPPQCV